MEWGTSSVPTAHFTVWKWVQQSQTSGNSKPWHWRRLYPSQELGCEAARPLCALSCGVAVAELAAVEQQGPGRLIIETLASVLD